MRRSFCAGLMLVSLMAGAVAAQSFQPDTFKRFVEMRVGKGEPVYWYCIGELYSYPDGKLLAKVEGIDTARLVKSETKLEGAHLTALQISRKIFLYRDPVTNEVLREFKGKPVQHIEYPYQQITYALKDGQLFSSVEQGSGARLQKIGPVGGASVRRFGATIIISTPLFLNFDTPRGKYEAFENYDFWLHLSHQSALERYQLNWNRFGDLPPFMGRGKGVMQLLAYRLDKYNDLPATMRDYLEKSAPLWRQPPRDLDEIRELQKGTVSTTK